MGSWTKKMRDKVAKIESAIVDAQDRGVCDSEGRTLAKSIRGAGKGDRNRCHSPEYYKNLAALYPQDRIRNWPRDEMGNLIGD